MRGMTQVVWFVAPALHADGEAQGKKDVNKTDGRSDFRSFFDDGARQLFAVLRSPVLPGFPSDVFYRCARFCLFCACVCVSGAIHIYIYVYRPLCIQRRQRST